MNRKQRRIAQTQEKPKAHNPLPMTRADTELLLKAIHLQLAGNLNDAEQIYRTLLASYPTNATLLHMLGMVYVHRGRPQEGLTFIEEAITINPRYAEAYNDRGLVLMTLAQYDEALASFDKTISIAPDYVGAFLNKSLIKLLYGQYEEGWRLYEFRWKSSGKKALRYFPQPLWLGKESLAGKTILLHGEQGFGDVIQFCRYALQVEALGATVILGLPASLMGVMSTLKGSLHLVTDGSALPEFDYHAPLMSLPLALGTRVDTIPSDPYLTAQPEFIDKWRPALDAKLGKSSFRVGLCWAGGHRPDRPDCTRIDARRSMSFDQLKPLLDVKGASFVSLQLGDPKSQLDDERVTDISSQLESWSDTAAVISLLDLVVTVDTAVCHLSAAMGKKTFLLNRYDTCWRWLLGRDDSPWYPSVTQFRQQQPGDWAEVVARVKTTLSNRDTTT